MFKSCAQSTTLPLHISSESSGDIGQDDWKWIWQHWMSCSTWCICTDGFSISAHRVLWGALCEWCMYTLQTSWLLAGDINIVFICILPLQQNFFSSIGDRKLSLLFRHGWRLFSGCWDMSIYQWALHITNVHTVPTAFSRLVQIYPI